MIEMLFKKITYEKMPTLSQFCGRLSKKNMVSIDTMKKWCNILLISVK